MESSTKRRTTKSGKRSQVPGFLIKTYRILENPKYREIINWVDNGKSFVVKDIKGFERDVLPNYFKHNKLTTFMRQLNMYGFRMKKLKDKSKHFTHRFFIRGKKEGLKRIFRKTKAKVAPSVSSGSDCAESEKKLKLMIGAFKELKAKHDKLKEVQKKNKFLLLEQALRSIDDREIKGGVVRMIEVISQAANYGQGEDGKDDWDKSQSKKLESIKEILKRFGRVKDKIGGSGQENRPSRASTVESQEVELRKRSFDEIEANEDDQSFFEEIVNFFPTSRRPSSKIELRQPGYSSEHCDFDDFDFKYGRGVRQMANSSENLFRFD